MSLSPRTKNVLFTSVVTLVAVGSAQASLTIDLRFTDGSHTKPAFAGDLTPITIQAWAIVRGAVGNSADDGLQSCIFAIKSNILTSGITGSITSATLPAGWGGIGSKSGLSSNISNDGIGDWGNASNTPLVLTANVFRPRTSKAVNNAIDWGDGDSPAGSVYHLLPDGGNEFLVGLFTFTPTAMSGMLQFVPVVPLGGTVVPAGWYEDTADNTAATPTGARSPSSGTYAPGTPNSANVNGVTIGLPEPTSLSLLGLGAFALVRRRRGN